LLSSVPDGIETISKSASDGDLVRKSEATSLFSDTCDLERLREDRCAGLWSGGKDVALKDNRDSGESLLAETSGTTSKSTSDADLVRKSATSLFSDTCDLERLREDRCAGLWSGGKDVALKDNRDSGESFLVETSGGETFSTTESENSSETGWT